MMDVDFLVRRHVQGGLLNKLFGDPEAAFDKAIADVGDKLTKSALGLAPDIVRQLERLAKQFGVAPDYLNFSIFGSRPTWPVSGKLAQALTVAKDIVAKAGKVPSMKKLTLDQDDAQVDKAISAFAKWASTDLRRMLTRAMWEHASKHAIPLLRKSGLDLTPKEMTQHILITFNQRLRQHSLVFRESYLLEQIMDLGSV